MGKHKALDDSTILIINERLIDMGKVAVSSLKARDFHLFDPLVSDCSCHLRSVWLLLTMKSHPKFDNFSDDELIILGMFVFLSKAKHTTYLLDSKFVWDERTDTHYLPEGWDKFIINTLNHRLLVYVYIKVELAIRLLAFYQNYILLNHVKYKQDLLQFFSDDVCTKYDHGYLPVIATIPSFIAIFEICLVENLPIFMLLFQTVISPEQKFISGAEILPILPVRNKFHFYDIKDICVRKDEPILILEIGHFVAKNDRSREDLFALVVKHVLEQDPYKFILSCAALHPNYSTGDNSYIKQDAEFIPMDKNNEPHYKFNEVSELTKTLKSEACREICQKKLRNFEVCDVFNVHHMYLGTLNYAEYKKSLTISDCNS